jgi:predicted membrane protein
LLCFIIAVCFSVWTVPALLYRPCLLLLVLLALLHGSCLLLLFVFALLYHSCLLLLFVFASVCFVCMFLFAYNFFMTWSLNCARLIQCGFAYTQTHKCITSKGKQTPVLEQFCSKEMHKIMPKEEVVTKPSDGAKSLDFMSNQRSGCAWPSSCVTKHGGVAPKTLIRRT